LDTSRLASVIIKSQKYADRFNFISDENSFASNLSSISVNGTQYSYVNPQSSDYFEYIFGRNFMFGYPYTGYIFPFVYNQTADQNQIFWADFMHKQEIFNPDKLLGVIITQAFYFSESDSIYSMAQLIEVNEVGLKSS
jgi:hypothetical protein